MSALLGVCGSLLNSITMEPCSQSNSSLANLRVCGDYSVTVNPRLEARHYSMMHPEDHMQWLGVVRDLSNAYNQI